MTDVTMIAHPEVELIDHMGSDGKIVAAARTSTKGEMAEWPREGMSDRDIGLINFLMKDQHASPFEHCVMTLRVTAPLPVGRQILRHRVNSYNEESARYRKLEPTFYLPPYNRPLVQIGKPGAYQYIPGTIDQHNETQDVMYRVYSDSYAAYERLLEQGVAREVARFLLPNGICSTMWITMKLRNAFQFLALRIHDSQASVPSFPQWEIEAVAEKIEKIVESLYPVTHQAWVKNGRRGF